MRTSTTTVSDYTVEITYPDEVAFVFNPLFCFIKTSGLSMTLEFVVSDGGTNRSIEVVTASGVGATISFERIAQLFFDDVLHVRTKSLSIGLWHDGVNIFSQTLLAVWGGMRIGERFSCYGEFDDDGSVWTRHAVWFRKFPFSVSLFSQTPKPHLWGYCNGVFASPFSYVNEVAGYHDCGNYEHYGIFEMTPSLDFISPTNFIMYGTGAPDSNGTFDETFDYTFNGDAAMGQCVKVKVSEDADGFYLRWIDRHGFIQYYLFTKGQDTVKSKLSSESINLDNRPFGAMHFPDVSRPVHIEGESTCRCCAVSLPDEIYGFVSTVTTSPVIDLFRGASKRGEMIWEPVKIVAASHSYNHKEELHDLEITFSRPEINAQSL